MQALQFNVTVPRFIAAKAAGAVLGKSVYYQGPLSTVRLVDIPEPELPSPQWVKVKTKYCGFCGSDLNLICLHDSPTASPFTSFPCVIGHEMVGEIVETGAEVTGFQPGDLVVVNPDLGCQTRGIDPMCPSCRAGRAANCENLAKGDLPPGMFTGLNSGVGGGFAPYMAAHQSQLFKTPDGMPLESAVMTEPVAVALQAVSDNPPCDGEKILVIGGGVIGNLIIQSIRVLAPGSHISVIEPAPFAAGLCRKMGADEIVRLGEVYERASALTGGEVYKPMIGKEIMMGGFSKLYDTVASSATLNLSMRLLAAAGTLSVVGIGGDVKLDLTPLWLKLQTVKGVYAHAQVDYRGQRRHSFDLALELMLEGKIDAQSLLTHKFKLHDYKKMIQVNMDKNRRRAVKTVVSFVD